MISMQVIEKLNNGMTNTIKTINGKIISLIKLNIKRFDGNAIIW
jgi:hypothetical protein